MIEFFMIFFSFVSYVFWCWGAWNIADVIADKYSIGLGGIFLFLSTGALPASVIAAIVLNAPA